MRIQILSDLHVDVVAGFVPEQHSTVDAVVVAGDVCEGLAKGMAFLRQHIPSPTPIILIAGNHDYYRTGLEEERAKASALAATHEIVFLDDAVAVMGGVRFIGATLWTDFAINGAQFRASNMSIARGRMSDYKRISLSKDPWRRLTPQATYRLHVLSRAFIEKELSKPFEGATVVVTHHAPHPRCVPEKFRNDTVNPAYVSDLSDVIDRYQPALWAHGHIHTSVDFTSGNTRVMSNPRGYGDENARFDPGLVIELGS